MQLTLSLSVLSMSNSRYLWWSSLPHLQDRQEHVPLERRYKEYLERIPRPLV
jgi:hypothetical protein